MVPYAISQIQPDGWHEVRVHKVRVLIFKLDK